MILKILSVLFNDKIQSILIFTLNYIHIHIYLYYTSIIDNKNLRNKLI